jgi:1-acyl-sn-glycerol-3-phosphate acyltransferase
MFTVQPISDSNYFRLHRFINWLTRAFFFRHVVTGRENFPTRGPYLIIANHLSMYDAPVVFMNSPTRTHMFGADKWRKTPGIAQLCDAVGTIWVTRGEADMEAIKRALTLLKNGGVMGIAPEGTRSPTQQLLKGKAGAALLVTRTGVPVVPFAITGTEQIAPELKRFRKTLVTLTIGKPFRLPEGKFKTEQLERYADLMMCHLAVLLPPRYRGVYAEHPLLEEARKVQGGG